jgi:hypothetical protein
MAQFGLDPLKAYTKQHVGSDGHIRNRVERPAVVVHPVKVEAPVTKEEAPQAKPTEVEKPASAVPPAPKSDKSVKPAPAKPVAEAKKVEAPTAPQATGEKASDESTVDPKESTKPATTPDAGADASTVKSS